MAYQLKDQDTTPPPPDPELQRSARRDAYAGVAMILMTAALIVSIVAFQIL